MEQTVKSFNMQYTALTDVGRRRNNNEDNCYCGNLWDENHILAIVVDGVGGYAGGEVAARMAVEETVNYLDKYRDGERSRLMAEAVVHANNRIYEQRSSEDRLYRMCCVMTAALFDLQAGYIYMAHVGDTRMYAFSDGRIVKLSHDHSPIGREEEAGYMTEIEAMQNPYRNMVDKAVGEHHLDNSSDFVETNVFPIGKGITWLMCSDGLSDMITSSQMSLALNSASTIEDKAKGLVDAANEAGGRDNVTVVLVSSMDSADEDTAHVMNEYARKVLPEQSGEEPDETFIPELPPEERDDDDAPVAEPVTGTAQQEPDIPAQEIPSADMDEVPGHTYEQHRRQFPWKPFLLFMATIALTGFIIVGYLHFKNIQDGTQPPVQGVQVVDTERLYYNIKNLPLD